MIFCLAGLMLSAQFASINGRVIDAQGNALEGAVVVIENSPHGTLTDENGAYKLTGFQPGYYVLVVTHVGFKSIRESLQIDGDFTRDFNLSPEGVVTNLPQKDQVKVIPPMPVTAIETVSIVGAIGQTKNGVFAVNDLKPEDIEPLNNGQDLPYLLRFTPSVVTTSDAGTGIGYTGMRIRGSDQSRINVTINGIAYNDPESQQVFWVNLPDFASSADNITIQRGVGTSTNGAGAFGGSVGVNTLKISNQPYASISNTYGSFDTWKHNVSFGTGKINNIWSLEGRLSQITSDGYIDRASSDLKSYYLAGEWNLASYYVKALVFGGKERTYQSWFGTPESRLNDDEEGMINYAARNGLSDAELDNLLTSGRTYNFYTYDNQVDDYAQDHYQLHLGGPIVRNLTFNIAGHYTYGRGYFEQYRTDDDFSDYGLNPIVLDATQEFSDEVDADGNPINSTFESNFGWDQVEFEHNIVNDANGDPITNPQGDVLLNSQAGISKTDVVRRRWLENDFYGTTYSLNYLHWIGDDQIQVNFGGAWNQYDGDHFGELTWMEHANGTNHADFYYLNNGLKTDFNNYLKINYDINHKLVVFADVQYRQVQYEVSGVDADLRTLATGDTLAFINPKGGLSYNVSGQDQVYASFAVGNREPMRNDYIDRPLGDKPKSESMQDIEFGYRRNTATYGFSVNLFNMQYTDQLILTGALNDVGTPIRTNVDESYRRGVEVILDWKIKEKWRIYGTATYSQNKIVDFNEQVISYDADFNFVGYEQRDLGTTDISYSPSLTAGGLLSYTFLKTKNHVGEVGWQTSYVGEQYLDNTMSETNKMDAYLVNDLRFTYTLKETMMSALTLNVLVNNVLDVDFVNNGYTYSYLYDSQRVSENFFYPQAGRNFLVGLTLDF
jgi:iron complex outermembrane receptor protein